MRFDEVMTSTLGHPAARRIRAARTVTIRGMPSISAIPDPALVARLRAAGCVFAEEEAVLLEEAASDERELEQLAERRIAGEPLEQVVGWAEFAGLRLVVEPGVFVPRRRTEFLAARAVGFARLAAANGRVPVVVDLCCGAGAIGAAIAEAAGPVELVAVDIDPAAVRAARRNLEPRGARVAEGDLFEALPGDILGRVDVLAVNAPYVPSDEIAMMPPEARDHEARVALDGGHDGLDLHRRIAASAREWLAPGGRLLIETSRLQAPTTAALLAEGGLTTEVLRDEERAATIVVGSR